MGEKAKEALRVQFDKHLRLEFHGAKITSDAGLLACRELDGALELTEISSLRVEMGNPGRNHCEDITSRLQFGRGCKRLSAFASHELSTGSPS